MKRRILSMLLLVVMLISLVPAQAFAEDTQAESSAVPTDVGNGEQQQTGEEAQQDDVFTGEEVVISDLPEPEYEEPTEEDPTLSPETPTETEDEAADGESDDAEKVSIRFNLTPEDLTLKVYPAETEDAEPISPEEDGSYLLIPGEYCYDAERDGYIPVLAASFTVTESAVIDVTLEEDSVSSVMGDTVASLTYPIEGTCGTDVKWSLDSDGKLTISGSGAMNNYLSNASVPWYTYMANIKTVEIGSGVSSIGNCAFYGCTALKNITIPGTVKAIGENAFLYCHALESVTISEGVETIGAYAFAYCDKLKSLTIGEGVKTLGKHAFIHCYALTSVTIPGSMETIGEYAFASCTALESVTISEGVKTIDWFAFQDCGKLTSVTIAESVTKIDGNAFRYCASLKYVYYSGTKEQWGKIDISGGNEFLTGAAIMYKLDSGTCGIGLKWTFYTGNLVISGTGAMENYSDSNPAPWSNYTSDIKTVEIGSGVTSIGTYAFNGCSALADVTISGSVTSIDDYAFGGCSKLETVTIGKSVTDIGQQIFENCSSLKYIYYSGTKTQWGEITINTPNDKLLGDDVTRICRGCGDNLTWSLDSAGKLTISGTGAMEDYFNADDNPWCDYIDKIKTVEIGSGVTTIGRSAFERCTALTTVTIGNSVTSIGDAAFIGCTALKSVIIPDKVTNIGESAFERCVGLKNITIPNSVKTIGAYAFSDCIALESVTISEGVESIGERAFSGCTSLKDITIPGSVMSIDAEAFYNCVALKSATISEGAQTIDDNAFRNCYALKDITIPGSVDTIGEGAFFACDALESVTISEGVKTIGWGAFFTCTALKSVTIPESVTSIDSAAFDGCTSLKYVYYSGTKEQWGKIDFHDDNDCLKNATLMCKLASGGCGGSLTWSFHSTGKLTIGGDGAMANYSDSSPAPWSQYKDDIKTVEIGPNVTSIGDCAFAGCRFLTRVTIPDSVTNVGSRAFENCAGLTSVKLSSSMTCLNDSFSGCAALTDITIPGSVAEIKDNAFLGCNNLKNVYYSGGIEQWSSITIGASGNESLDKASKQFTDLQVTLDREYITGDALSKNTEQIKATVTPAEWSKYLIWEAENPTYEDVEQKIIEVDENGVVTFCEGYAGTAYAVAKIKVNGVLITAARCRVDVTWNPTGLELYNNLDVKEAVQLGTTAVTTELYSKNYAEFDIVLVLPQNRPDFTVYGSDSAPSVDDDEPVDNGVAITDARFEDESPAAEKFDLVVVDDRRLAVVPKIDVTDPAEAKTVKSSYSSKVIVTINGHDFETESSLKLTVKKTQPKLKATVAAFNSFYLGQSNIIEITGATATAINRNEDKDKGKSTAVPAWLTLSKDGSGVLSIDDAYELKKNASGSVYLSVETEEWAIPATVTLSVKNTYKAPKLKLSASSVKFSSVDSYGMELQLLPTVKGETLESLNVTGIESSTEGFKVAEGSFDAGTGKFTLEKDSKITKSGKVTLTVSFGDNAGTVNLTLSAQIVKPTIKLKTSSVTLSSKYDDVATVDLVTTPADFKIITPDIADGYTNIDITTSDDNIIAKLNVYGQLVVHAEDGTPENKTYKVTVSIKDTNSKATLTVKTSKKVDPTMTVKATGAIDLTYPDNPVTITPTVKNYSGEFDGYEGTITVKNRGEKEGVTEDINNYFKVTQNGNVLELRKKYGVELNVGSTYTAKITLVDEDNELSVPASNTVKITVKQTAVNLKLSKSSLSLNKKAGDTAEINVTCSTKDYKLENANVNSALKITDKKGIPYSVDNEPLDVSYAEGVLTVGVNDKTEYGATYKVIISAEEGYKQHTLTVTIPTVNKAAVSSSLKVSGSIDVLRGGSKLTLKPTYKNVTTTDYTETVKIYSNENSKNYETDATNKFAVNGREITNISASAEFKYKVQIVTVFNKGIEENNQRYTIESPKVSFTVKTGTAKMKVTGTPTLYLKDWHSQGKFTLTNTDLTLNGIADVKIKDPKYENMFELYKYGNGKQFAIGFNGNPIETGASRLKTASITLSIWHTGNNTAKPDSTVTLKVTLVK